MPASSPDFDIQKSAYRWILISLAATVYTMSFVTRFSWPPLVPEIMPVMGISHTEAMAYMTAFYIGYGLTQIPSGLLADRVGPRLVMFGALSLQGLGLLSLSFTENYQIGFCSRVLCGLGGGCLYSSCLKSIVTWFTSAQRGLAFGVLYLAPPLGVALPNLTMPFLSAGFGWQGAFRAVGLVILGLALVLLRVMPEFRTPEAGPRPKLLANLRRIVRNRSIIMAAAAGGSTNWSQVGFAAAANSYLTGSLGFTVFEAGRVVMVYGLVGLLVPLMVGYLCDRFPMRKKLMIIGVHLLLIADLLAFGEVRGVVPVYLTAGLFGLLVTFSNPIYTIIIAERAGPEWAGAAGGLGNTIMQVAALTAPLAVGLAADFRGDYGLTWIILAAGPLVGLIFAALIVGRPPEA